LLAEKKLKTTEKEKVKKYLLNKGFSYTNVSKAIDNCENLEDN
jgi:SOS response regulatory protein OraA/RecX